MAERTLTVKILGDERSLQRAFNTATRSSRQFTGTIKEQAAQAIVARVQERQSLEKLAAEYQLVAERAVHGSEAQIAAAKLARDAQARLAASFGSVTHEAARGGLAARGLSRDLEAASRGALAGSGLFRSFGRSLAFASGGFLAFGGAAGFIRKSIDAAKEAQVAQKQLAQQLANNGQSFAAYRGEIDHTVLRISALAGIENDELLGGLTTILRTTPNVNKALRDLGTAADLARAKHISLAAAATIIAKTEAGNTTLLRRQGIQIAKNATAEEALATLRRAVAGQARSGTTEQERFGAVLHDTEEIIGTGILPTLNKYLASGTKWLQQMNESGKLQKDVANAAHDFETAVSDVAGVVKTADRLTGSFANTLKLLIALKFASAAAGWVTGFRQTGIAAKNAEGQVEGFKGSLSTLGALQLAPIVVPIAIEVEANTEKKVKDAFGHVAADVFSAVENIATAGITGRSIPQQIVDAITGGGDAKNKAKKAGTDVGDAFAEAAAKAAHGLALKPDAATQTGGGGGGLSLTAAQRNTFFDNAISRILLRGGLGDLQQQLAAIEKAKALLDKRLAGTKDITRRLNLEDQILQLASQAQAIRGQISQAALEKRQQRFSDLIASLQLDVTKAEATAQLSDDLDALQRLQNGIKAQIKAEGQTVELAQQLFENRQRIAAVRAQQVTGRQFEALGLTATGEQRTPGVRALKRELGNVSEEIKGTFLDTNKTRSLLQSIRKVLSGGLGAVGQDVRAKIQGILGDIDRQIDQHTRKNETKFRHASTAALLAGIPGLTGEQRRLLRSRLSQVGAGGTVPGSQSQAFALAGAGQTIVVDHKSELDGRVIEKSVTKYQRRGRKRRPSSRRGSSAGLN